MRIVEAYRSEDGSLHNDKIRAAASDLHKAMPARLYDSNAKVLDWNGCFQIFQNLDIVKKAIADFESTGEIASPEGK